MKRPVIYFVPVRWSLHLDCGHEQETTQKPGATIDGHLAECEQCTRDLAALGPEPEGITYVIRPCSDGGRKWQVEDATRNLIVSKHHNLASAARACAVLNQTT